MTTESQAAYQDHLRDAPRRQRGAPRGFEAGLERRRAGLGGHHQNVVDGAGRDGDGDVRGPLADRPRHRPRALRDGHRATTSTTPSPPPAPRSRPGPRRPWRERLAILRRAAELISERQMDDARGHGDRGRQEPDRGARRGRGGGRPHPLLRPDRRRTTTCYDHPMDNLGDADGPHPLDPPAARRLRGHQPVQLPDGARRRPDRRRDDGRQHGRLQAVERGAAVGASSSIEAYRDAGVPTGVINLVMGPGETVGEELQDHPGIDGIVFTGSYEVGMELFRTFSKRARARRSSRWAARTRRSCRGRPTSRRRPRGSCAAAFGFGGQKCSANSRVYVERPVHDELVRLLVEKTEAITIGDPLVRENWLGPDHRPEGGRSAPGRGRRGAARRDRVHRRRAADGRRPGARLLRRADRRRRPAGRPSAVPRRAVRAVHRGPCRRLARRGARPRERHDLRADRRRLQRGPGRGRALPRHDRGRRART